MKKFLNLYVLVFSLFICSTTNSYSAQLKVVSLNNLSDLDALSIAVANGTSPRKIAEYEARLNGLDEFKSRKYIKQRAADLIQRSKEMQEIALIFEGVELQRPKYDFDAKHWRGCSLDYLIRPLITKRGATFSLHIKFDWPDYLLAKRHICGGGKSRVPSGYGGYTFGIGANKKLEFPVSDFDMAERMSENRSDIGLKFYCRPRPDTVSGTFRSQGQARFRCRVLKRKIVLESREGGWALDF